MPAPKQVKSVQDTAAPRRQDRGMVAESFRRALAALAVFTAVSLADPAQAAVLAIVGAKVYPAPDAVPIAHGVVIVRDGKIAAIGREGALRPPSGAEVIDGRGKVLTAGFWNNHVHILTHELLHADVRPAADLTQVLDAMLNRWGFTTVFDVASVLDNTNIVRERIAKGEVHGPKILTVGDPFYPPNGVPIYIRQFYADEHIVPQEVTSIPQALARETSQIGRGADGVKLFVGAIVGGDVGVLPMDLDLAKALVAGAHKAGKPVFAHPSNTQGVNIAIDSGVDVLAHTAPMMGPWKPDLVARLRAHNMALVPTLTLFEVEAKKFNESAEDSANDMAAARQQVQVYAAAGGDILFGTDVGYTDAFDTTEEYRQMAMAGMDWRAILASLTTTPARRFGVAAHKGRLAAGADADLVLLGADPAADPAAFAKVAATIRGGAVIWRAP
jgi:imidazolonepropionase-like amidohydrolase